MPSVSVSPSSPLPSGDSESRRRFDDHVNGKQKMEQSSKPGKSNLEQILSDSRLRSVDPNVPAHLWMLHGKLYDFSEFVDRHPGGYEFILLGRGRDCTELFESVHCLSDVDFAPIFEKYRLPDSEQLPSSDPQDLFEWKPEGFYATLVRRVRHYFARSDVDVPKGQNAPIGNYKATTFYWAKVLLMGIGYWYCLYQALICGGYVSAFLCGLLFECLGFNVMHDGSHGAISKRPFWNIIAQIWAPWTHWDDWIWLRHHVYGHHSHTGINKKDPDMNNAKAFLRKHPEGRVSGFFLRFQHLYVWPLLMFFPNQHFGQTLQYFTARRRQKIFGLPLDSNRTKMSLHITNTIFAISFLVHFVLPFFFLTWWQVLLVNYLISMAAGISFFFVVAPNHDTVESALENHPDGSTCIDWGEQQVRSSCDHSTSGSLMSWIITHGWGGMNYQTIHHLFPSVSHVHYPALQPIVEKTAQEFGIQYNKKSTWMAAMASFYELLRRMASAKPAQH